MTCEKTHDISRFVCSVLQQAHYPTSYSNQAKLTIFPGFTAIFPWCSLPKRAAKITAGGLGKPYSQPYTLCVNALKISSVE